MKKIGLTLISIVLITLVGVFSYRYYVIKQMPAPSGTIQFDGTVINNDKAKVSYDFIGSFIKKEIYYAIDLPLQNLNVESVEHNLFVEDSSQISYLDPNLNQVTVDVPSQLKLRENGLYQFSVITQKDNVYLEYHFNVNVDLKPIIKLPKLSSVQGQILYFEIDNAPLNSNIIVTSDFSESNIFQKDNTISFYIPMWYAAEVQEYPLSIELNDERYDYVINLNSYEFRELHFTVPTSTVSSTVGNPDATPQFKAVIYPTYESAINEVYWQGNFMYPVEGATITSHFGDMRYVNNAKVPTRHVGIDYAIACDTEVKASNGGEVIVAQNLIITGNTVVIDHGLGLKTYYEHMNDLNVSVGDIVEKGEIIGHVGTTGYSTGCHLHFQAMVKNQSINPEFLYTWMD